MEIKNVSLHELRKMNGSEGLVIQGCGGDLQEWVNGINDMLTESEILQNGSGFEKTYTFNNEEMTCLLFPFDDVKLDVGKLAIWRLQTHETFSGCVTALDKSFHIFRKFFHKARPENIARNSVGIIQRVILRSVLSGHRPEGGK